MQGQLSTSTATSISIRFIVLVLSVKLFHEASTDKDYVVGDVYSLPSLHAWVDLL